MDYVSQKCKCNSGYESDGSKCVFKNTYINKPVLSSPTVSTSPTIPIKIPIVKTKSNDQICQDSYGINSNWGGTKNNNGGLICGCKSGYLWNEQKTSCIMDYNKICSDKFGSGNTWNGNINKGGGPDCVETKSNDQICNKDYGVNSIWTNKLNDTGGPICDCKIGYQFNKGRTQCIITPKAEVKAVIPTTIKVPEVKAMQNEVKENTTNITKPEPINLNKVIVTNTTTEIKPKSFWQKIKGLFGF